MNTRFTTDTTANNMTAVLKRKNTCQVPDDLHTLYNNIVHSQSTINNNVLQMHANQIDMLTTFKKQDAFNMYLINSICQLTERVRELEMKKKELTIDECIDNINLDDIIDILDMDEPFQ